MASAREGLSCKGSFSWRETTRQGSISHGKDSGSVGSGGGEVGGEWLNMQDRTFEAPSANLSS